MCGISGYLDLKNGVSIQTLRQMNDVIRHRGPDDEGYALIGTEQTLLFGGQDTAPILGLPVLSDTTDSGAFLGCRNRRSSEGIIVEDLPLDERLFSRIRHAYDELRALR